MRFHSQSGHRTESVNVVMRASLPLTTRALVGSGSLSGIGNILAQGDVGKKVLVLVQTAIRKNYGELVMESLNAAGFDAGVLELPDGEACKAHERLLEVWQILQQRNFSRTDTIVAVGGGAICDLSGFAASTYLRGIKLVLAPTTLLAQVDAAIGGKTGINLESGKNLAGSFYFPEAVVVDPAVLTTLPEKELRSGLGEIIKYALIDSTIIANTEYRGGQRSLLKLLEEMLPEPGFTADNKAVEGVITACIKMKLAVVAKDPHEGRLRRCLNLGHTLGHAIEKVTAYGVTHGEAVSMGLVFACRVANKLGTMDESDTERVVKLLQSAQLPTALPVDLPRQQLISAMTFDKKRAGNEISFVLPTRPLGTVDLDMKIEVDQLSELL